MIKYYVIIVHLTLFAPLHACHQDGRVVKALDLRSNGRIVRVGSNPTPGNCVPIPFFLYISLFFYFLRFKNRLESVMFGLVLSCVTNHKKSWGGFEYILSMKI